MDVLERIIGSLSGDEVRRFKILSNRFKAEEEKKLLVLFDALREGGSNEEQLLSRLYEGTNARSKNSYYRLRNQLLTNLEKSLLFYSTHTSSRSAVDAHSTLQLALLLRNRSLHREAYHYLRKAEKLAQEFEAYNLLEVIYDEMVQLAALYDVEIEQVIERRRANQRRLEVIRQTSEVLGMITRQLSRRNYARSQRSQSVIDTLEQIRSQLEEHETLFQSASGKILITRTVAAILLQKSAFGELAEYALGAFEDLERSGLFSEETHPLRLNLRIWRINALQKLLRLDEAWQAIQGFRADLEAYQSRFYAEYAFYYFSSRIFNLKYTGRLEEAATVIEEAFSSVELFPNPLYPLYLQISLADQYFCEGRYPACLEALDQLVQQANFGMLDEEIRCYAAVFQLVALYEAGDYEAVEAHAHTLRRQFGVLLRESADGRTEAFVHILLRMNQAALAGRQPRLRTLISRFLEAYPPSEVGGNSILRYESYLEARLSGRPYYDVLREALP
jgi:tetratricopeptide (TPR) repeat protein